MAIRKTVNLLPQQFQTDVNKKFLNATLDQLISPGTMEMLNGFVGRRDVDNFKTLEELEQEKQDAASENPDNSESLNDNAAINEGYSSEYAKKLQEQRRKIEALKRKGEAPKVNIKRRTTISYSLIDRYDVSLPNPVYTCESFGKVVINIKVSPQGDVTDASFNKNSSTTQNGCLVDNAINYALKAKFSSANTSSEQPGTITYLFQGE